MTNVLKQTYYSGRGVSNCLWPFTTVHCRARPFWPYWPFMTVADMDRIRTWDGLTLYLTRAYPGLTMELPRSRQGPDKDLIRE
jgi:hypothetical protein